MLTLISLYFALPFLLSSLFMLFHLPAGYPVMGLAFSLQF